MERDRKRATERAKAHGPIESRQEQVQAGEIPRVQASWRLVARDQEWVAATHVSAHTATQVSAAHRTEAQNKASWGAAQAGVPSLDIGALHPHGGPSVEGCSIGRRSSAHPHRGCTSISNISCWLTGPEESSGRPAANRVKAAAARFNTRQ